MASSVLDYIFRELAISYLDRTDLAHVDPNELHSDSIGHGARESDLRRDDALAQIASAGYVRGNLRLLHGGTEGKVPSPGRCRPESGGGASRTSARAPLQSRPVRPATRRPRC